MVSHFGQPSTGGGRFPMWICHMTRMSLPPISSKGRRRVITSHRMIPHEKMSHFSVYVVPVATKFRANVKHNELLIGSEQI